MRWSNVKLILAREIRDQLRDRRTMFMIVVLPILLYPLLGMSMLQFSQFAQEKTRRVMVIGAQNLPNEPALIETDHFAPRLFKSPEQAQQLILTFADAGLGSPAGALDARSVACAAVGKGDCDAALYIPPDFGRRLEAFREAIRKGFSEATRGGGAADVNPMQTGPKPEIIYSTAYQKSQLAFAPLHNVLRQWNAEILKSNLAAAKLPDAMSTPLEPDVIDVADETGYRGSAVWSSLLPIILILWALTGAFYPAVDLCAGEKERGTLETLLSSPAQRSEIVLGKLLTIMLFSSVTATLNLFSMTFLGSLVFGRMHAVGPPPLASVAWLAVALVPVSALFSALLPGVGGVRAEHQGGAVLPDAVTSGDDAAGHPAGSLRNGVELRDEPHSGHGDRAVVARGVGGALCRGGSVPPAGVMHDPSLLPLCHSLGHRAIQLGIGPFPRE